MRRENFLGMMEEEFQKMTELNEQKGHDYAGDEDALSNLKEAAERLGITPEQVWAVYADKHWSAVMTFCREGQVASEPIEGRIRDIMVYGMLLLGLIEDGKKAIGDRVRERMEKHPAGLCCEPDPDPRVEALCNLPADHEGQHSWEVVA